MPKLSEHVAAPIETGMCSRLDAGRWFDNLGRLAGSMTGRDKFVAQAAHGSNSGLAGEIFETAMFSRGLPVGSLLEYLR